MKTERNTYKLNNPYLNNDEKIIVESWFQLPGNVMFYTFLLLAIYHLYNSMSLIYLFGIPVFVNLLVGWINWYVYNRQLATKLALSLFHPVITGILGVVVGVFLYLRGEPLLALITAFTGIFSFLFPELHIMLYSVLAQKYGMHPKYVFAKKQFGITFPFNNSDE